MIKHQMQEKRAELSEKLQTLEREVTDEIASVQETVTGSVESVKENVQETISSIQEAFNVSRHVREHPWLAVGGGVVAGYLAHELLVREDDRLPAAMASDGTPQTAPSAARGWLSETFGDEIDNVKRLAARTALVLLGGAVKDAMGGEVGASIGQFVDRLTSKLDEPAGSQHYSGSRPCTQ